MSTLQVGTISEKVTDAGVAVDGVTLKDGAIVVANGANIGSASDTDAMAISSSGVVTFSQNTVGAGGMDLLYAVTSSSSVSSHDISSTYINSTYDNYLLVGYFEGDADTRYLQCQVFVGGTVQTASGYYGYGSAGVDGENYANTNSDTDLFTATSDSMGGEDGEGVSINAVFQNANNTQAPFCASGIATKHNNNGHHGAFTFSGSLVPANRASVVNGLRFKMHSGNVNYAKFKLYGLRD